MIYLNEADIEHIGLDWKVLADVIAEASEAYASGECAQPLKPYLKFGDEHNRIIAMPAYVSRPVQSAGLKWIASFPANITAGLPRAHSVTVLNNPATGEPTAFIKGSLISAVRTAAVSAALLRRLLPASTMDLEALIIGMGPIGRMHIRMLNSLFSNRLARIRVYDQREIDVHDWLTGAEMRIPVERCDSWQTAYADADLVFTCTASIERYIEERPKPTALLMHISLRDYALEALEKLGMVIVDSWEEVCRADTDIERLHLHQGLLEEHTISLAAILANQEAALAQAAAAGPTLFAPMGMAVFDIAVAVHYVMEAERLGIGIALD